MAKQLDDRVPLPLWVLVHSQRYAMGRQTYANSDSARLVADHWDDLPEFIRKQMRDDFTRMDWGGASRTEDRAAWLFMFDGVDPDA